MQAGVVGWNAIRVCNPTKQLIDWHSECRFVKQWVPELRDVSSEQIIKGESILGYPAPVVPFTERATWMTKPAVLQTQFSRSQGRYDGHLPQTWITQEGKSSTPQTAAEERSAKENADAQFI